MASEGGMADAAERGWDAVAIDPSDNVATALQPLPPGPVRVRRGGAVAVITAIEAIPMGHKLALEPLAEQSAVRKYGEVIGLVTQAVQAGGLVHVHNLQSRRARASA
jgi:altronate dehydratase small subunit